MVIFPFPHRGRGYDHTNGHREGWLEKKGLAKGWLTIFVHLESQSATNDGRGGALRGRS